MKNTHPDLVRRDFLATALAAGFTTSFASRPASAQNPRKGPELIVRNRRPLDFETPVEVFESLYTPNDLFFVRSHFGAPGVGLIDPWAISIDGGVKNKLSLTLGDLAKLPQVSIPAVLQCSGNGRALFSPTVPGLPWLKGAVGNAIWTGVRLADVLKQAGVEPGMAHVQLKGADGPPMPKTPAFHRSIPIDRALAESTLLATQMNGAPLPVEHGGPVRLVVPGWAGNHWIKWLRSITVAKEESPGFYMQTGYKMPIKPTPPGVDLKPSEVKSVTEMNVKSLISSPLAGSRIKPGRVEIHGVAWTGGDATVTRVEVSLGVVSGAEAAWSEASFVDPARPFTWRRWRVAFDLQGATSLVIRSRATDSRGEIQPEVSPWNKSGYLWNGYDQVACEVR